MNAVPPIRNERRSAARHRVLKGALIVLNGGRSSFACAVRNLSETGALLRVESVIGVPEVFDLLIERQTFHCRVVRRGPKDVAVQFEDGPARRV